MKRITQLLAGFTAALLMATLLMVGGRVASADDSTVSANISGGTLAITSFTSNFAYSATLNGTVQHPTSSFSVGVNDPTGSGAGWKLQAVIGTLTNAGNKTIPVTGHNIESVNMTPGTGIAPQNSITYPMQLPVGSAATIYNSAADKGMGQSSIAFSTQLDLPVETYAGDYSATLTVTIVAGP
jgi:hypothetical protein